MEKRTKFKDFMKFLSSTRGDLANITAPPYFLAPVSVVEVGACWTQRPTLFASATKESSAERRALAILKWIIIALKSQFYIGGDPSTSIKKPLNAFLGELFFGNWKDQNATSHLVAEQVSHHPPITAVYMWDKENGIWGEGYTRVEMSFAGAVDIKQTGHAVVHIEKYDEDFLIPLPNARVKGFLSGRLYPELYGTYHIVSSSGFVSELKFEGQGILWGGTKNKFEAVIYSRDDSEKKPIYSIEGQWSDTFTIRDASGEILEVYNTKAAENQPLDAEVEEMCNQDPWETRKAWENVFSALRDGDVGKVVTEKSKVENAQRQMRRKENDEGSVWEPLLFSILGENYTLFEKLGSAVGWKLEDEKTKGVWKVDSEKARKAERPFRTGLTPLG